jgi:hypothetical protein
MALKRGVAKGAIKMARASRKGFGSYKVVTVEKPKKVKKAKKPKKVKKVKKVKKSAAKKAKKAAKRATKKPVAKKTAKKPSTKKVNLTKVYITLYLTISHYIVLVKKKSSYHNHIHTVKYLHIV